MIVATRKSEQNKALIDPWTVVHFGAGLAAGMMDIGFVPAVGAAVGYEFAEHAFEDSGAGQRLFQTSGPETTGNAVVDVIVFAAAWYIGRRWNERG